MHNLELILLAIIVVVNIIVGFDFIVYVIKNAPKSSIFSKRIWKIGLFCFILLVYWYLNNMKFI